MPRLGLGVTARRGASPALLASLPSLDLDFLKQVYQMSLLGKNFSDIITFSRPSASTRINPLGLVESVAANVPCIDHSPVNLATGVGAQTLALAKDRSYAITAVGGTVAVAGAGVNVSQMGAAAGAIHTPAGVGTVDVTFTPFGGVTALHVREVLGLGVWEQRTNLIARSSDWSTGWAPNTAPVRTPAYGLAPDNTMGTTRFQGSASNSGWYLLPNYAAGKTLSASIFVRHVSGAGELKFGCDGGTANNTGYIVYKPSTNQVTYTGGDAALLGVEDFGNGIRRLKLRYTTTLASNSLIVYQSGGVPLDCEIWGSQLEEGAFVTPYIPTSGSQVTRAADVPPCNTVSPWLSQSAGTLYVEFDGINPAMPVASLDVGTSSTVGIYVSSGTQIVGEISGGTNVSDSIASPSSVNKVAYAFSANDRAMSLNGRTVQKSSSGSIPAGINTLNVGRNRSGTQFINGHIRKLRYIPKRLPDAQLQSLAA